MRGVRCVVVVVEVELLPLLERRAVRNEDDGDEDMFEEEAMKEESTSNARFEPSVTGSDWD